MPLLLQDSLIFMHITRSELRYNQYLMRYNANMLRELDCSLPQTRGIGRTGRGSYRRPGIEPERRGEYSRRLASTGGPPYGDVGDLPFHYVGKHRRAMLSDVLALKIKIDAQRAAMEALASDAEDLKLRYGV